MDLTALLRDRYGLDAVLTAADGGHDPDAAVWRAVAPDGRVYAVKRSAAGVAHGLHAVAHLSAHHVPGVPATVPTLDGRACLVLDGGELSVTEWITGEGGWGQVLGERWRAYGELMAAVHAVSALGGLPVEDWRPIATGPTRVMDERMSGLGDEIAVVWRANSARILAAADRTEKLAATLDRDVPYVLTHGDPHLGNVIQDERGVWLIDWDGAAMAPAERDLSFFHYGWIADPAMTAADKAAFFAGYGGREPDPARLSYYLHARALEDLESWARSGLEDAAAEDRDFSLRIFRGLVGDGGVLTLSEG
ncbi:hypothetical protein Afil01_18330 [Actinorhabdospora filicis]|uniref:Aminoglycoside phosphotransferase domain-containing protein n=1 Tax=Actinorhabdospora filicis TaxID=1785913 RepID=A0A9W6SJX3_9ACTN|nr:phosphotransferase [Actinorhabdospora filicis]GLZ77026.1 hypothetical protein Afil01_18330 [Actinorhabdospora filicis]